MERKSRESLSPRGTLCVLQPPVFVRIAQEVEELPYSPLVRDLELSAVVTVEAQLYLLPPVLCYEFPAA